MYKIFRQRLRPLPTVLCALLTLLPGYASRLSAADEAAISPAQMDFIKQEVMRELRESDFLQKEIEIGIQAYIDKQRAQQAAAQAAQERRLAERAREVRRVDHKRDHVFGNPEAQVSIIEYSDFECPYCQAYHATPRKIIEQYGDRVNWVYRHFPLPFHNPVAQSTAEASECINELAGNEAFWTFTDALYARGPVGDEDQALADKLRLADELGVDRAKFSECLDSDRYRARVEEDLREGAQIGINGTPGTVVLNNSSGEVRLVTGAVPPESLAAAVEQVLN